MAYFYHQMVRSRRPQSSHRAPHEIGLSLVMITLRKKTDDAMDTACDIMDNSSGTPYTDDTTTDNSDKLRTLVPDG